MRVQEQEQPPRSLLEHQQQRPPENVSPDRGEGPPPPGRAGEALYAHLEAASTAPRLLRLDAPPVSRHGIASVSRVIHVAGDLPSR
jgi:hypothetical protein